MTRKHKRNTLRLVATAPGGVLLVVAAHLGAAVAAAAVGLGLLTAGGDPGAAAPASTVAQTFIVQAATATEAARVVERHGGVVVRDLSIIRSVVAELRPAQRAAVSLSARLYDNGEAELTAKGGKSKGGGSAGNTHYPTLIGADRLHAEGITGGGVTVAVLDSGMWGHADLVADSAGRVRFLDSFDVFDGKYGNAKDEYGHGTHVTAIAVSADNGSGRFDGVAPDADVVYVRAFDRDGRGTYANVIAGIQWIVAMKDVYGIRVVNLSFSAAPQSHYWDDPLNQAVMEAWRAGLVIVASAGNRGPSPMTIGVPGNNPYIITVGAMTDNFTPDNDSDDVLASFSSTGPTFEGFVKPDLVAPGGHSRALMDRGTTLATSYPEFHDGGQYFVMSGTSQAAAMVTGAVALMLEAAPQLTPDEVKFRLMDAANPALYSDGAGSFAYSVFQQGAGRLDAYSAVHSFGDGAANRGLDIDADLAGLQHYRGTADAWTHTVKKKGESTTTYTYYVADENGDPLSGDGFEWAGNYFRDAGFAWSDGFVWNDAFAWSDAFMWNDGFVWNDAFAWSDAYAWSDGFAWNDLNTEALFTEAWVPQE